LNPVRIIDFICLAIYSLATYFINKKLPDIKPEIKLIAVVVY